jgi:hypothetical protein
MNGDLISDKGLLSTYSPLMQTVASAGDKVDAVYLALLARKPAASEKERLSAALSGRDEAVSALIYALLNTKQFIFIQ